MGDMIKCGLCGTHHYRNDGCPDDEVHSQGCSDGNCKLRIGSIAGQVTNGGCRCLSDLPTLQRIEVEKKIITQQKTIKNLTENGGLLRMAMDQQDKNTQRLEGIIRALRKLQWDEFIDRTFPGLATKHETNELFNEATEMLINGNISVEETLA